MRLFVAFDIPDEMRHALDKFIRGFQSVCPGARWVRAENIHLTLKFVGHIEETKLPAIKNCLAEVKSNGPIEIAFRDFGFFPNERHPRVFCLEMESSPNLAALAGGIESSLEPLGIPREARVFRPHLTLARFKSEEGLARLREMAALIPRQDFGIATTTEFHLYESVLNSSGTVHTRLSSYRFFAGGTP